MKFESYYPIVSFGRDAESKPFAEDYYGGPLSYEEIKAIAEICNEILSTQSPEDRKLLSRKFTSQVFPEDAPKDWEPGEREELVRKRTLEKAKQGSPLYKSGSKPKKSGFIYLAFNPDTNLFKIGLSKHVPTRIRWLQSSDGIRIRLVHHFPTSNMAKSEDALHGMFEEQHVYGEWFRLSDADVNDIKCVEYDQPIE